MESSAEDTAVRIAFDLDETLIPWNDEFPVEPGAPHPWLSPLFREPLRSGTAALLRRLRADGHEIWIYTTSGRGAGYLRIWLLAHGVYVAGVVNRERHDREAKAFPYRFPHCTKYPPAFGIDLLIDDSVAIFEEGRRYGFEVLHIAPADAEWTDTVLNEVARRVRRS